MSGNGTSSVTGGEAFTNDSRFRNKNLSVMMPVKVRTMRDYEQQLHELRKDNFHLKLRLFYIQQGKGGHASNGVEFETFRQQVQRDLETLVKEIDKRNALIQKNWVTIKQQHEAIEDINEEKLAIEKELVTLKTKMSLAEAACKEETKMADVISEMEKQNEQLEQGMKALRQRLSELEEHELPDLRSQVDKRNFVIQSLTTQLRLREKTVRSLESQVSLLSSAQPLTDTFLDRLDRSLANSDFDGAVAAKDQFKADFIAIASKKKSTLDTSPTSSPASTLKGQLDSLEAEIQAKEAVIEGLNEEVSQLKSCVRLSKDRCHGLEGEIKRSAQVHARICFEKDKLLESLQKRLQELEENVQESQTVKSRYTALERECNSLRDALCEKAGFIEELLAERDKAALETEKSFHGLVHSMKQKDEHIEQLRAQLKDNEVQRRPTNSHSLCSFQLPEGAKSNVGEEVWGSKSINLIELSAAEDSVSPTENNCERTPLELSKTPLELSKTPLELSKTPLELSNDGSLSDDLGELYKVLCEVGEGIEALSLGERSSLEHGSDIVKELKSALKQVRERGYCLVPRPEKSICGDMSAGAGSQNGSSEKCDGNWLEPVLSEKLSEICAVLSADATAESSTGWRLGDLVSHLDLFLAKVKGNDSELSVVREKEMALVKENKTLREHLQTLMGAIVKVRSSERQMRTELSDFREGVLGDLAPLMECVGFLREEVDTLSLSTKERPCTNNCSSADELVYAVDGFGRLVPFSGSATPSPEPRAFKGSFGTKDATQQTEEGNYSVEQLKNELNKSQAQVKFLQKSLKDSFSVKMSDSSRPLIEIDQNRPAPEGSPDKSANRRWRRQLTNQKMSEFGLSENVFELQEEIFFLVLRIEDLERQLGCTASATAHDRSEKSLAALLLEPRVKALQSRNGALEQQLQEMQEVSAVLLCRLEELAAFLEQLLVSDGSGAPGSVSLPPDTVARMRQLVASSRDFSLSVSQSILGGSDTGSVLSDRSALRGSIQKELPPAPSSDRPKSGSSNNAKRARKLDPKDIPARDEDVIFLEDEVSRLREQVEQQQEEIDDLTRRLSKNTGDLPSSGTLLSPPSPRSRKHPGTPASHYDGEEGTDASWRYQDQVVVVQASDSDDILLLLNERGLPENVYLRSTWEKRPLGEKVSVEGGAHIVRRPSEDDDADESSSSTTPCRRREEEERETVLPAIGRFQCWSSDSDIWSEPDRSVSEQRMGGLACTSFNRHPRRSPKGSRKMSNGTSRTEDGGEAGRTPAKETMSWRSTESGRSKRSSQLGRSQPQKLEKLLRRMQGCSAKLEDALAAHRELCLAMSDAVNPQTAKETAGQVQIPPSGLIDTHMQTMRKLQFKLEEMVINSELLREILAERVESSSVAKTEALSVNTSSPEAETAQKLQQCCKELECKERREEILKRAIAHEQAAKLQIEKELLDCQKVLHALRGGQDWNLGLQTENTESRRSVLSPDEVEKLKSELEDRIREVNEAKRAVERLGREVTELQHDKVALLQKLEATHKEHETLLESSSNKISELVTKLGPLSTQSKNQIEEIRSLKEVNAGLQDELDAAALKLDMLHRELEAFGLLQKENRDLRDSIHTSKNQEITLRDKLQCVIQEFQLLRKATEEYCRNELVLKEENESLSTKVLKLTTQVEELEADAEELRRELEQSEKERRTAQEREWSALERGRETERMADEMRRDLDTTRVQLEAMKNRCIKLEEELSSSNETQQQLASANRDLQRFLESKTEQLCAMEASNRDLQQTLLQRGKELGPEWKHTMVLQEFEDQKRRLQSELFELRHQVERARQEDRCTSTEHDAHCRNQTRNSPVAQASTHIHVSDFLTGRRGNKSLPIHANASSLQDPSHSRSHHTSPDLGIDSDPMPEREDVDSSAAVGGGFEEHWQHRMGGNWSVTSVHSAPEAVGGACSLCMQKGASDTSGKNKLNWTFAGEAVDYPLDDCSPSKNVLPVECPTLSTNSVRLCAVVQLVDHELLKKRVDESICLVRRLEGTVQQLLDVLLQLVPEFDEAPDSKQLLQEALSGCHSIKVCLVESFKLICSFTISPMQDTKDECRQRCCYENKQLKDELTSLQEKYAQRGIELQSAIEQISTFRQKKEGMERAISRQLSKTKMVLKQTKGNLNVLRSRDPKPDKK